MSSKVTYRQQFTRCGKQRCRKCREGEGHGPYWYAYWSEKGRTVSKYIGIHLPAHLEAEQQSEADAEQHTISAAPVSPTSPIMPTLRVYVLGQFRVERRIGQEWQPVDSRILHRRRARALLGCLLNSTGRRLGREQVMEQLWPDLDIDVAANRLNGAVHELRQILEPSLSRPAASQFLRLERDMLELADSSHIWIDAEAFENILKEANAANTATEPERVEHLLTEAAALYRGSYLLEELYSEWTIQRRDALQRSWIGLLLQLAHFYAERNDFVGAIEILDRLRTADPTNETALQRLMILLTRLERRGEALQVYRQHVTMLKRDYESEPLPETRKLYHSLREGSTPHVYMTTTGGTSKLHPANEKESVSSSGNRASAQKQPAQEIAFRRPSFQLSRHNQSPLVGRQRERDTMRQVMLSVEEISNKSTRPTRKESGSTPTTHASPASLSSTASRHTHFLLLQGEPGIGKTRLAEELSTEAYTRDWAVAWSRTYEQEGTIPYHPWTELLRTLLQGTPSRAETDEATSARSGTASLRLERLGPLLPELTTYAATSSPRPTSPPLPHEQERLHLWETVLELLNTLSKAHPLLLILDDLHWTDDSSLELLTYITHHLHEQRILIVGTCRDGELPPTHRLRMLISDLRREQTIVTLSIQPLSQAQIGTLVSHLPQNVIERIQDQASGNPFFAEELARYIGTAAIDDVPPLPPDSSLEKRLHLRTPGIAPQEKHLQERTASSMPEAIAAVLERRLGRLSAECVALLGKAAVLGGSFELGLLLSMTNERAEDSTLDLLEEALYAGILTEEGTGAHITYHFWHPLIVSHLYDRLSAARRAQLHRRAAEAIKTIHMNAQSGKVAAAIIYHLNRGGGDSASIAYYAELAGTNAYTLASYAEAQQYYVQGYQALMGKPFSATDAPDIHIITQRITQFPLPQASSKAYDPLHLCRILERIAECCVIQGDFNDARQLYEYILSQRTGNTFRLHSAFSELEDEVRQRQEAQIQALLWREIGITWIATGDYEKVYECFLHGKAAMVQAGVTQGAAWACLHIQYGEMLRLNGNYHEARHYLEEALAMLEKEVSPSSSTEHARREQPFLSEEQRPFPGKELHTRTERALLGDLLELGNAHEQLGIVAASVGQLSEGLRHMHIAREIYEQHELFTATARICGNLGAAYTMKSDLTSARNYLHRSFDLAERIGDLPNMIFVTGNLGDVASRSGDLIEAESWFRRGLDLAERINYREHMSWCTVELAVVQQDLGQLREAAASIRRAISIGRAIKSSRCVRYALVGLGDLRIVEAIIACKLQPTRKEIYALRLPVSPHPPVCQRLLARAKSTLQRASALEGLDIEPAINGKLLLASAYFLSDDLETARQMTLQTLKEAEEHETTRVIGRAQRLLGRILSAQGHYQESRHYFEQALHLFRERELRLDYARTLHGYGFTLIQRAMREHDAASNDTYIKQHEFHTGMNYLHEARNIFAACHAAIDITWVEQLLASFESHNVVLS